MFVQKDLRLAARTSDGESSGWYYRSDDTAESLLENGYFDPAAALVRVGDRIAVFASRSGKGEHLDLAVTFRSKNKVRVSVLASVR